MLNKHLEKIILGKLVEPPTTSQLKLITQTSAFILNSSDDEIFQITGYAGTGKTTVISAIINALDEFKIKTVLMAPTGRAAKVLCNFSGKPAYTIHKKIYRQKSSKDGFGKFVLGKNLAFGTFYIIDEASMIGNQLAETSIFGSGNLLNDLLEYVYSGKRCKLILIGDTAQLPPVNYPESPALIIDNFQMLGFTVSSICLTEVVRHSVQSGILFNATLIRELISSGKSKIPRFRIKKFNDIKRISDLEVIQELNKCYIKFGIAETLVVTRSNKRANLFNSGIRKTILGREEQISTGDYLMVVKNNYFWLSGNDEIDFIANGDIVEVLKIRKYEERYGYHFVNVRLRHVDDDLREFEAKLVLESLEIESAAFSTEENKKFFYSVYEDYKHFKSKKAGYDAVRNDPFFNALQVKYAYAVTCHKSQGGQWKAVFVDPGYFSPDMIDREYLRWLYTAITRASECLYLVNFKNDFFEELV